MGFLDLMMAVIVIAFPLAEPCFIEYQFHPSYCPSQKR